MTPFQNPSIPASLYTSLAFSSNQNFILDFDKCERNHATANVNRQSLVYYS